MSLGLALAFGAALPAEARLSFVRSSASTFVAARAAADAGDARRAAILYASLAAGDPSDRIVANRALAQAILAGDFPLALRMAARHPRHELGVDARLLLAADALRHRKGEAAVASGWPPELGFIAPFVRAWSLAERGKWRDGVALLDSVKPDEMLAPLVPEHKALILLSAGQAEQAKPFIAPALAEAKGRTSRLRIAFAAGLARAGERQAAAELLSGRDEALRSAAAKLAGDRKPALPIASAAQGFSELVTALAIGLGENDGRSLPLGLVQVARHADPANAQAVVLLGLLLERSGRVDDALAVLRSVPDTSPFVGEARDAEIRALLGAQRSPEAIARSEIFAARRDATAEDWSRFGDALDAAAKHARAAEAYAKALALVEAGGPGPEIWSLQLLHGASLEQAGQWPEAERALEKAHALAPDNPVVLNYLGYARLERGEQLDEAEVLIAEASRRAPNEPSITDSLGWAQFKRGRVADAIRTLERAAAADPAQAEIHEHLGDALYTAGRKYEARFAWNAALVTAEADVRKRVEAKVATGLSAATAAP